MQKHKIEWQGKFKSRLYSIYHYYDCNLTSNPATEDCIASFSTDILEGQNTQRFSLKFDHWIIRQNADVMHCTADFISVSTNETKTVALYCMELLVIRFTAAQMKIILVPENSKVY